MAGGDDGALNGCINAHISKITINQRVESYSVRVKIYTNPNCSKRNP